MTIDQTSSPKDMNRFKKVDIYWKCLYFASLMMCMYIYLLQTSKYKAKRIEIPEEWIKNIRQNRINEKNCEEEFDSEDESYQLPSNITFPLVPPNLEFVFHNKLPKCGSSTMNNILKVLSIQNEFNFLKAYPNTSSVFDQKILVDYLDTKTNPPFFFLKHQYWINFTQYDSKQPTFINVIRDPIDWFTSRFYFARYGWNRKPGCREEYCAIKKKDFEMDIDECVHRRHKECVLPWPYIPFFCGADDDCIDAVSEEEKKRSYEIAKRRLVEDFFIVGILEEFEDTLKAFEIVLPSFFNGATEVWKGEFVQQQQHKTKTIYKKEMSKTSRRFFEKGPLKYEIKLYKFAKRLFHLRLKSLGLNSTKT